MDIGSLSDSLYVSLCVCVYARTCFFNGYINLGMHGLGVGERRKPITTSGFLEAIFGNSEDEVLID